MNYSALRERSTEVLALTSLHVTEFNELLQYFSPLWERHHRRHILDGKWHQFAAHQKRTNALAQLITFRAA